MLVKHVEAPQRVSLPWQLLYPGRLIT
jgi:hypothetical protein